jgi:hypothetical protein
VPFSTGNIISAFGTDSDDVASADLDAPPASSRWLISQVVASYAGGTLSNGNLTITCTDGADEPTVTTLLDVDLTATGPTVLQFNPPIPAVAGQACSAALTAGGSSVVGKVTIFAHIS